jgi:hypothetical protein
MVFCTVQLSGRAFPDWYTMSKQSGNERPGQGGAEEAAATVYGCIGTQLANRPCPALCGEEGEQAVELVDHHIVHHTALDGRVVRAWTTTGLQVESSSGYLGA